MFNTYQAPYPMPQAPAYGRSAYQQPMMYPQQQVQPVMQENVPQVRFVASREEALAASVMPGIPCYLVDRAHNMLFYKFIDPQTGMPEMEEYTKTQQQPTQYVTIDALAAFRQEMEQTLEQRIAALTASRAASRKAVNSNDE